jgi:hypothetical protein
LLVGELAYNPERVLALEERGHRLYGLWTPEPYWFNAVGPMPFGHVEDLPRERWRETVEKLRPDLIYALLNWQAVPFVHHVLTDRPKTVPLVWHFKEGPFICLEKGMWPELLELYEQSQGQIYISPEMRDWFRTVLPASSSGRSLILDGDLPKREWLDARPSARLSASDGQIHTVVPGRPIGLHPENVGELAVEGVHLHFYGDFTQGQWRRWIEDALRLAPAHLHLHPQVSQDRWVEEFSRYDAGWLHFLPSENRGELGRAIWDDLNYPARISTLAAAGLPLIQYDNSESVVATQSLSKELGVGLFGRSIAEVAAKLRDEQLLTSLQGRMWEQRMKFTFDHHADRLLQFFREVIKAHRT